MSASRNKPKDPWSSGKDGESPPSLPRRLSGRRGGAARKSSKSSDLGPGGRALSPGLRAMAQSVQRVPTLNLKSIGGDNGALTPSREGSGSSTGAIAPLAGASDDVATGPPFTPLEVRGSSGGGSETNSPSGPASGTIRPTNTTPNRTPTRGYHYPMTPADLSLPPSREVSMIQPRTVGTLAGDVLHEDSSASVGSGHSESRTGRSSGSGPEMNNSSRRGSGVFVKGVSMLSKAPPSSAVNATTNSSTSRDRRVPNVPQQQHQTYPTQADRAKRSSKQFLSSVPQREPSGRNFRAVYYGHLGRHGDPAVRHAYEQVLSANNPNGATAARSGDGGGSSSGSISLPALVNLHRDMGPPPPGLQVLCWKLVLGFLPTHPDAWPAVIKNRLLQFKDVLGTLDFVLRQNLRRQDLMLHVALEAEARRGSGGGSMTPGSQGAAGPLSNSVLQHQQQSSQQSLLQQQSSLQTPSSSQAQRLDGIGGGGVLFWNSFFPPDRPPAEYAANLRATAGSSTAINDASTASLSQLSLATPQTTARGTAHRHPKSSSQAKMPLGDGRSHVRSASTGADAVLRNASQQGPPSVTTPEAQPMQPTTGLLPSPSLPVPQPSPTAPSGGSATPKSNLVTPSGTYRPLSSPHATATVPLSQPSQKPTSTSSSRSVSRQHSTGITAPPTTPGSAVGAMTPPQKTPSPSVDRVQTLMLRSESFNPESWDEESDDLRPETLVRLVALTSQNQFLLQCAMSKLLHLRAMAEFLLHLCDEPVDAYWLLWLLSRKLNLLMPVSGMRRVLGPSVRRFMAEVRSDSRLGTLPDHFFKLGWPLEHLVFSWMSSCFANSCPTTMTELVWNSVVVMARKPDRVFEFLYRLCYTTLRAMRTKFLQCSTATRLKSVASTLPDFNYEQAIHESCVAIGYFANSGAGDNRSDLTKRAPAATGIPSGPDPSSGTGIGGVARPRR
eukprot:Clim_evm14s35 gene=Clim_evmTU14s35